MPLEIPDILKQTPTEHTTTPEIIRSLEMATEMGVEHLTKKNMTMLKKAELIVLPEKQREMVIKLGKVSIEAAKAVEQLKRELRRIERDKPN